MTLTRRQKQLGAAILVVLIIVVIIIRRRSGGSDDEVQADVTVQVAPAVLKPITERIQALGTVEARPGHIAEIAAPQASRIVAIYVAEGDFVRPSQPLVQLDVSVTNAQLQGARAALETAQQAFERTQRLLKEGIAPRKDVETAASELAKARADLEQARRTEQLSTLRSPISGVVTSLNGTLSGAVDANAPVVQIVDPRGLEVHFHLSPDQAGRVTPGTKVELEAGTGTVTGISAALDTATRTVDVRATITTPTRALKVGESVNGAILLTSRNSTVVVPVGALVPEGDATVVYVIDAQQIAHAIPVTVGARTDTEVAIASGLHGGEMVVTQGAYGVSDGAHVKASR